MIAALLLALVCSPARSLADGYSLVPEVRWSAATGATAYRIYAREPGAEWAAVADLPCWAEEDGTRRCYGVDHPIPLQRYLDAPPGAEREFCVRGVNAAGESARCSPVVGLCWPFVIR